MLKARTSLSPRFSEKKHSSFELWALKHHSKMSPKWDQLYFVLSFSTKRAWQSGSKHFKRWYRRTLRQTMVDSCYCLDPVVSEGMSQVSRRSEVAYINGAPLTPGYLLALLRELSHVLQGLQKLQSEKRTKLVFCTSSKKGSESRSSRFEPKISLISSSTGSGPPLKVFFNTLQRFKIGWHWISKLFLQLFERTRILPMGFTISTM